jgi:hypothetical protein
MERKKTVFNRLQFIFLLILIISCYIKGFAAPSIFVAIFTAPALWAIVLHFSRDIIVHLNQLAEGTIAESMEVFTLEIIF